MKCKTNLILTIGEWFLIQLWEYILFCFPSNVNFIKGYLKKKYYFVTLK